MPAKRLGITITTPDYPRELILQRYSEYLADMRAKKDEHFKRCEALLRSSEHVPHYENPSPPSHFLATPFAHYRDYIRHALENGKVTFYNCACDHCGTELINNEPNVYSATPSPYHASPPCGRVSCPGCGWSSWTEVLS